MVIEAVASSKLQVNKTTEAHNKPEQEDVHQATGSGCVQKKHAQVKPLLRVTANIQLVPQRSEPAKEACS